MLEKLKKSGRPRKIWRGEYAATFELAICQPKSVTVYAVLLPFNYRAAKYHKVEEEEEEVKERQSKRKRQCVQEELSQCAPKCVNFTGKV